MTTTSPRSSRRAPSSRALAVIAVCGVLALGACGAPGSGSSTQPTSKSPSSISTDPAKAGKVTLTVWDQEVRGGQNAEITKLNREFEAKYPNVTIKRTSKSFSDLKTTLKLALSGNNPPDVVEANQGYPDMVSFVKAGLLAPAGLLRRGLRLDHALPVHAPGAQQGSARTRHHFGEGQLYGLSQIGEYVGVYYNKDQAKQARSHAADHLVASSPRTSPRSRPRASCRSSSATWTSGRPSTPSGSSRPLPPASRRSATWSSAPAARSGPRPDRARRHDPAGLGEEGLLPLGRQRHRLRRREQAVRPGQGRLLHHRHLGGRRP